MLRAIDAVLQLLLYLPHELNLPLAHRIERANAYEEAQRLHSASGRAHVHRRTCTSWITHTQTRARAHTFKPPATRNDREKEPSKTKNNTHGDRGSGETLTATNGGHASTVWSH